MIAWKWMRWGLLLLLVLTIGMCRPISPVHPIGNVNPQAELARTLAIIRTATPAAPKTLKILFYGQSITSPAWTDPATAHLRATYPDTRFIVRNTAIPGFDASSLERTAARDIDEFYPDLIVFHVYGDHHARERIIRTMRSHTAAEVIIETDHVVEPVEPTCHQGLYWGRFPGCKGLVWHNQKSWEEHTSATLLPEAARQYGLAIEPRRWAWNTYLWRHHMQQGDLLVDGLHPNDAGWTLMAHLFERWFDRVAANWTPHAQTLVSDQALPAGDTVQLNVTGNRIELIAGAPLGGKVSALIDGKPPSDTDGCWLTSRTNMLPNVPFWPAIQQVSVSPSIHRAERWTLMVHDLSPDQTRFRFRLYAPGGLFDGEGDPQQHFTSRSGDVRIDPQDWALGWGKALKGQGVPEGFRISWDRHYICGDEPAVPLTPDRIEVRHVIATGLANGPHHILLKLSPEARAAIRSVRVYRPPLAS